MPVEIMELVVRATITEEKAKNKTPPAATQGHQPLDKKALAEDIVEQVLAILKHQKER